MTTTVELLPKYSRSEEIHNAASHFFGAIFAIGTLITFIVLGNINQYGFFHMAPFYIYSVFMLMMFLVSGFYHSRPFDSLSRAKARLVDHCDIYAFVAATYFPICIYGINNQPISIILLVIEIVLGLSGVALNLFPTDSRWIRLSTFIIYILQGWAIIIFYPFNIGLPFLTFLFILIGGIIYSVGSIMYAIGHYKRWSHTIFHYFVLAAAIVQFVGILFLI